MSLLREIQNSAVDANEPITSLLRKCKILAVRLGNSELKNWVELELNGYSANDYLPEYRIFSVNCKGHFSGQFGKALKYADIPKNCIPEEAHETLFTFHLDLPVSAIESLIKDSTDGTVQQPWPAEITPIVGKYIYENMICLQAWKVIPVNGLVSTLDIIRNKILNFVLEIESENPDAGDTPIHSTVIPNERVSQIFNTYISGQVQNMSAGGINVTQNAEIKENSEIFEKLIDTLSKSQGDKVITETLIQFVEEMRGAKNKNEFSKYYKEFMSVFSDHIQVYGTILAPMLPALISMLP